MGKNKRTLLLPMDDGQSRTDKLHLPFPSEQMLDGLRMKNNSPVFDEMEALRYMERTDKQFKERMRNFVSSISK